MKRNFAGGLALLLGVLVNFAGTATWAAPAVNLSSPNDAIKFTLAADDGGLTYSVTTADKPVIEKSAIVVSIDGVEVTKGAELGEPKRYEMDEKYAYRGVHSQAVNRCRGATIPVKHAGSKTEFTIDVRVFNDGAAFRYVIPGDADKSRTPDEATTFHLPAYSTVWYHDLGGHYEAVHEKRELAEVREGQWVAPPLTVKLPGGAGYAAISEAALYDYPGMALEADGHGGFKLAPGHKHPISYPFRLRYERDIERVSKLAAINGTITSPWRVIMIGKDLNATVNSDIISNLCPPPDPKLFPEGMATDWVKPGRAVWRYLDGGESGFEGMKEFCRMAGELGFEYNVLEGFWRRFTDEQLKELVQYGKERGVGIIVWVNSRGMRDPQARQAIYKRCRDAGIVGLKIDFFDHEAKEIVDLYETLLKEAAENRLLLNFHGSNKPTGEPRTWPNELVRESIRGMESRNVRNRAVHDATLPFTRFLVGHAEYTPVIFGERRADTTWAHQVAIPAVFTAPLLTYGANPRAMLDSPAAEMLKSIPAVWDETVVLPQSEIGQLAAFARRSGDTWFLAVLNGPDARQIKVPLSFLGEGQYKAMVVRDADKPDAMNVENTTAKRGDEVTIDMPHGGGFIARFSKN